jgi:hypothetical protein
VQLLPSLSLSSCQLESTLPPTAHVLLSQSQQGNLVRHYLRLLNGLERIYQPSCKPLYVTKTSHHKHKTFIYEYPFAHRKSTIERYFLAVQTSSMVTIFTTETSR